MNNFNKKGSYIWLICSLYIYILTDFGIFKLKHDKQTLVLHHWTIDLRLIFPDFHAESGRNAIYRVGLGQLHKHS